MSRAGFDHPGLGTGLAIVKDGKVLLYLRARPPEAGHWNIVGGKVDFGELTADAARREAEEETGLSIKSIDFLGFVEEVFAADGQHWVSAIYATGDFSGDPAITEPDKLPAMGWFALDELPQPLSRFAAKAVAMLKARSKS